MENHKSNSQKQQLTHQHNQETQKKLKIKHTLKLRRPMTQNGLHSHTTTIL
jgi:hypothetical protein